MFLSYVMVGRLFGTGVLIILYLCPIAAHLGSRSTVYPGYHTFFTLFSLPINHG
jgi:hypothetical protein